MYRLNPKQWYWWFVDWIIGKLEIKWEQLIRLYFDNVENQRIFLRYSWFISYLFLYIILLPFTFYFVSFFCSIILSHLLQRIFSDRSSQLDLLNRIFSDGSSPVDLLRPSPSDLFQRPFSSPTALNPITSTPSWNTSSVALPSTSDRIKYIFIISLVHMTYMLYLEGEC